ncbi:hypothetical protein A1Q2_01356 [Trichosporon asahii var. asahii CBS 8904]|uniref:Uncharacterized protein n=1 Tax=Trichosporon asahii var. asahii (strain CBS 8904) TaxID=1220162 RepID=K1VJL1_TRIAC|nr:hypothetical protein A1Q2_01356 [Trichosporon asahii var. asahii CBS 8904]
MPNYNFNFRFFAHTTDVAEYIHKRREDEEEGETQLNQIKERKLRERAKLEEEFRTAKAERDKINPNLLEEQLEIAEYTADRTGVGYPVPQEGREP